MKRFFKLAALVAACLMVFAACTGGEGDLANLGPIARYEKVMEQEAQNLPDFGIMQYEDKTLKVEGMPEEVVWLTADMPDFGSSLTKKGGTLHDYLTKYPENYRFVGPQGNHDARSLMNKFTGLMWSSDETLERGPLLCTHWAFGADNQTVYYKLRENVTFSDGSPCTADDYVWGWQMMCDPNLDDPWYNKYYAKKEVTKINDYCIAVKWLESDKLSRYELMGEASQIPICKKFFGGKLEKDWHIEYNWKYCPTVDPYTFDEEKSIKGELFVLKRVKDWWGNSVPFLKNMANFDYLEFKVIPGGKDIIKELFYKGEIDLFGMTEAQYWNDAATQPNVTNGYIDRWISNFTVTYGLGGFFFNTKSCDFLADRRVRYALYYAFDIQGVIDNVMQGEAVRRHNIGAGQVYAGVDFNNHSIRKPDFDPVKAGELLAEAGYSELGPDGIRMTKDGKRASFELLYGTKTLNEHFTYIKEQAKKAGVEIELNVLEQGWIPLLMAKEFQAMYVWWTYGLKPSLWQSFNSADADRPNSNNITAYASAEMDALLAIEDDPEKTLEEKAENNKKIEQLVHDEALIIPHWTTNFSRVGAWKWIKFPAWGNQKYVKSVFPDQFYNYAWFDQDIKDEVEKARAENKVFEPKIWKPSTRYAE